MKLGHYHHAHVDIALGLQPKDVAPALPIFADKVHMVARNFNAYGLVRIAEPSYGFSYAVERVYGLSFRHGHYALARKTLAARHPDVNTLEHAVHADREEVVPRGGEEARKKGGQVLLGCNSRARGLGRVEARSGSERGNNGVRGRDGDDAAVQLYLEDGAVDDDYLADYLAEGTEAVVAVLEDLRD